MSLVGNFNSMFPPPKKKENQTIALWDPSHHYGNGKSWDLSPAHLNDDTNRLARRLAVTSGIPRIDFDNVRHE
jgi:hypothetical protein